MSSLAFTRIPASLRRAAYLALVLGLLQLVFGAIVRISGSGMGCGDNWPKCAGYWFPPLNRPDLIIELSHRVIAITIVIAVGVLVALSWRYRALPEVGGKGGVLRTSLLAISIWPALALLGALTVFTGNPAWATVIHKFVAVSLVAVLIVAVVRTGGYGDRVALAGGTQSRAVGGATAAAAMALIVVLLGGLTAKLPGAAVACAGFPLCGEGSLGGSAQHVQLTHRIFAYLLVLHLVALPFVFRKRSEPVVLQRFAWAGMLLGLLQVVWAAWMVTGGFPPVVRSLHQATGILIFSVAFSMYYVARIAAGRTVIANDTRETVTASGASVSGARA